MTRSRNCYLALGLITALAPRLAGQTPVRVELSSPTSTVAVGDRVPLTARVFDESGNELDVPVRFFSSSRREFPIGRDGLLRPTQGGEFVAYVRVNTARNVRDSIAFVVGFPAVRNIVFEPTAERLFVGAAVRHNATVFDESDFLRRDVPVTWSTDDPSIASVDRFGDLTAHREGVVTLTAMAEGVRETHRYQVVADPIRTLTLSLSQDSARTGDVLHATAVALDAAGQRINDAPISYALIAHPEDTVVAQFPPAEIDQRGRFVSQKAGDYTILAIAGEHARVRV